MTDVDALLDAARRPEVEVSVYLGPPELATEHANLVQQRRVKAEETAEQMRVHTLTTTVRALPHKAWARLVADHPPREDNAADRRRVVNMATFFDAAVPPCLPSLTADQYQKLDGIISEGEWDKLCTAVWAVNTGSVDVPFSRNGSPTSPTSDET